jgi:hypothetical protein
LKIFVWYGAGVWRRLIPILVMTFCIFYVWQETKPKNLAPQNQVQTIQQARVGIFDVKINVDAQVVLDGKPLGTFRANKVQQLIHLKPGVHSFRLSASGYRSKTIAVSLTDQLVTLSFKLERETQAMTTTPTVAFNDLENAIKNADAGAKLILSAGDYRISNSLTIEKSIKLIGAGQTKTRIELAASLIFKNAKVSLEGLHFKKVGRQDFTLINLENARFFIQDCHFTGNKSYKIAIPKGNGISISSFSKGLISESYIENNSLNGISIIKNSNLRVDHVKIQNNRYNAILIRDKSFLQAWYSTFIENNVGIELEDTSQISLYHSRIKLSQKSGIIFSNESYGEIKNNLIQENGSGISHNSYNFISISNNTFIKNDEAISALKRSQFEQTSNIFLKNSWNIKDKQ